MLPHKEQSFFYPEEVFLQSASKATKMLREATWNQMRMMGFIEFSPHHAMPL